MDFRIKVFISVAQNLSFTKAANELHISQPAISRHIQELESSYKIQLFVRSGNKIELTVAGRIFLKYAEEIAGIYRALQLEINLLSGSFSGELRIGASTTIAQYVIPPLVAKYIGMFPEIRLSLMTGNTEQIENALDENKIDIGLIEGNHRKQSLKYFPFQDDELVLVTSVQNKVELEVSPDELCRLPLVLRESGSGTLEVIEHALAKHHKKISQMNVLLQLGSTESIKLFLENSPTVFAIVSITAVTKELTANKLKVIEVSNLDLYRKFSFVIPQGSHNEIRERFMRFIVQSL